MLDDFDEHVSRNIRKNESITSIGSQLELKHNYSRYGEGSHFKGGTTASKLILDVQDLSDEELPSVS